MDEEVRLYISIPSNRGWKSGFGASFGCLTHYLTTGTKAPGYNLTHYIFRSLYNTSCISKARDHFVDEMLNGLDVTDPLTGEVTRKPFTHWLSLDDDMTFPMDIVDRLLAHGKDVVSCNARHKMDEIKGSCQGMDGQSIDSTGKTGIEELKTMGGAIFLAKIDAFRHLPKPRFEVLWSPSHQDYVGEDVYFSTLLKVNGVQLWCDHDTSQLVGHIGDYEYRWANA